MKSFELTYGYEIYNDHHEPRKITHGARNCNEPIQH